MKDKPSPAGPGEARPNHDQPVGSLHSAPVGATLGVLPASAVDLPYSLSPTQGEQLLRFIDASRQVMRRYNFFGWTQSHLSGLVPHLAVICGSWQRSSRCLTFEAFESVLITPASRQALCAPEGALVSAATAAWIEGRGRPLILGLQHFMGESESAARQLRAELGDVQLLVHGSARPLRPSEVETIFLFIVPPGRSVGVTGLHLASCTQPYLHSVWLRVLEVEAQLNLAPSAPRPLAAGRTPSGGSITGREQQILNGVRDGKNNLQIGQALSISPLTVKNHLQKILRKLGAANRAQAVAIALQKGLIDASQR